MTAIHKAAGAIRNGSDEIASASDDLSRRTERQTPSPDGTAALAFQPENQNEGWEEF